MNILRRYHGSIYTPAHTKLMRKMSNTKTSGFVGASNPKYLAERYIDANNKNEISISHKGIKFETDAGNG